MASFTAYKYYDGGANGSTSPGATRNTPSRGSPRAKLRGSPITQSATPPSGPPPSSALSGWQAVVDKKSGRTYFFHASSGATSWTDPAKLGIVGGAGGGSGGGKVSGAPGGAPRGGGQGRSMRAFSSPTSPMDGFGEGFAGLGLGRSGGGGDEDYGDGEDEEEDYDDNEDYGNDDDGKVRVCACVWGRMGLALCCEMCDDDTMAEPLFLPSCPLPQRLSCTLCQLLPCSHVVLAFFGCIVHLQEEAAGEGADEVDQAKLEKHSCT